jgi:hypothetical protein
MPLAQAVAVSQLSNWGAIDISERFLHDTCLSSKKYQYSLPRHYHIISYHITLHLSSKSFFIFKRLRLFLCFLGTSSDMDNDAASLLSTEVAFSYYMDFISCVHYLLAVEMGEVRDPHCPSTPIHAAALFPSNEFIAAEKRDRWLVDGELFQKHSKFIAEKLAVIEEESFRQLLGYLKLDRMGRVDVDDYAWLVMMQWAKNISFINRKCDEKMDWFTRQEERKAKASMQSDAHKIAERKKRPFFSLYAAERLVEMQSTKTQSYLLSVENAISQSTFQQADSMRCSELYIKDMVASSGSGSGSTAKKGKVPLNGLLKSSSFWGLYSGLFY